MGFKSDFGWQQDLLPEVKKACAMHLVAEAPAEEDMRRNTDLIVLRLDAIRVAVRLRRYRYLSEYGHQFTIRTSRDHSKNPIELAKVIQGWGDYMFYGFASKDSKTLARWSLLDLNVFRLWHMRYLVTNRGLMPGDETPNPDGSSSFRAYNISDIGSGFVVASEPPVEELLSWLA
ncbi:hypothetical protein [Mycolicibacterium sp.]|uniref:hypothetical protein n=1 Tax=Mycolicibacterium sp. TaxID=2320850 RepID=UPI0028AB4863|nr:hypothetical protein [Mycolicibacterium sp.]